MPIQFISESNTFKLDTASTSYVLGINRYGYLLHYYYGAYVPDAELGYLAFTVRHGSHYPRVEMESETTPFFSKDLYRMEYSCNGCGDFRGSALSILRSTGTNDTDIKYVSHNIYSGKPTIEGQPATYATENEATTLEILCLDEVSGAQVTLFYTVFESLGVMTRHVSVKNTSDGVLNIQRVASTCVDFHDARDMDIIHLYGSWGKERRFERMPIMHGTQSVSSKRGASSSMHNPFIALCSHDANEEYGEVYGFNLVYTGNFLASAEMDPDGAARVLMGINPENFNWRLEPGESFTTPEAVMVYSNNGIGGMSRIYHRLYRNNLCRGKWKHKRRPILVNNWEATYFDFDEEKLYDIAKTASEIGIEMLVMDDGWFGDRNSAKSGLGDWFVNEEKLKGGLGKLVDRVNSLGLKFGIWFEPEMVSRDSNLFRNHPEWALQISGRAMSIARHQYVLDMSRADVREYLFDCISRVMDSANIAYIKWDFNRNLTEVGSALLDSDRQGEVFHRYVLGLYELLERILTAYPELLLEGCASGGGRFDPAWLYYAPQIWTSDDTDAIERLDIQYGTSMCYPVSSMGAHVSACPNHQTGRTTSFTTRGHVAMSGTFGYELDLTRLTDEEKAIIKAQCDEYHKYYNLINKGDLYRLISPWKDRTRCAWSFVSEDKSEVLVTYVVMRSVIYDRHYIRLAGLDENKRYRNEQTGQILSGKTLMSAGICIEGKLKDHESKIIHLVSEKEVCEFIEEDTLPVKVPYMANGVRYSGVYNCHDGALMLYWDNVNEDMIDEYSAELYGLGYIKHQSLDNENIRSVTYTADGAMVHIYYLKRTGEFRVITQSNAKFATNPYRYTKICSLKVTQVGIGTGTGMCYVIRLEDGTFVVIDGNNLSLGANNQKLPKATYEALYDTLLEQKPEGIKDIVISAWFITHGHGDHFGMISRFLQDYEEKVYVKMLVGNDASDRVYKEVGGIRYFPFDRVNGHFGGCYYKKAHTGEQYFFPGITFTVLSTHEDVYPKAFEAYNNLSTVFDGVVDKQVLKASSRNGETRFIWLGDIQKKVAEKLLAMYGETLKCDVLQIAHHCNANGGSYQLYSTCKPVVVFWCSNEHVFNQWRVARQNRYLVETAEIHRQDQGDYTLEFDKNII